MSIIKLASETSDKHFQLRKEEANAIKDKSTQRAAGKAISQQQEAHNKLEQTLASRKGMREGSAGWHQATREIGDLQGKTRQFAETHRNLIGANSKVLPSVKSAVELKSKLNAATPAPGASAGVGELAGKAKSFLATSHGKGLALGAGVVGAGLLAHHLMKPRQQQQKSYGY